MKTKSPGAFLLSGLLHGLVLLLIFVFTFLFNQEAKPEPVVFEWVDAPPEGPVAAPEPAPNISFEPPPPVPVPVAVPPPQPQPQPPPPQPQPRPQPAPQRPPPPASRPEPARTITYEEFVRQQGAPRTPRPPQPQPRPAAPAPTINTAEITRRLDELSRTTQTGQLSGQEMRELDAYVARLLAALRMAHRKPPELSDLLTARVQFSIAANGAISQPRIVASSGNASFDESVLAAFRSVGSIGPVPGGKSDVWVVNFRMREE